MTVLKWLALWLCFAIIFAGLAGRQSVKYYRLSKGGVTVSGIVQAKKPHMLLEYSFRVNGHDHIGLGRGDVGPPSFYEGSVGDRVLIHYLPNDPDINCLQDPDKLFRAEIVPVLSVVLLFPTMAVGLLAFRFRKYHET